MTNLQVSTDPPEDVIDTVSGQQGHKHVLQRHTGDRLMYIHTLNSSENRFQQLQVQLLVTGFQIFMFMFLRVIAVTFLIL